MGFFSKKQSQIDEHEPTLEAVLRQFNRLLQAIEKGDDPAVLLKA